MLSIFYIFSWKLFLDYVLAHLHCSPLSFKINPFLTISNHITSDIDEIHIGNKDWNYACCFVSFGVHFLTEMGWTLRKFRSRYQDVRTQNKRIHVFPVHFVSLHLDCDKKIESGSTYYFYYQ